MKLEDGDVSWQQDWGNCMDGHAVQAEAGMQGRLSFFIQMLPRGKFWLEVADEKLTSSIMRIRFVFVVFVD